MRTAVLIVLVFIHTPLFAGPVQRHIERVMPRGGQRGTMVEVKIQGVELNDVREAIFYRGGIEAVEFSAAKEIPHRCLHHGARIEQEVTCKFRIAADCPVGVHAFRLRTARELTTVSTFRVTPFPVVAEAEPSRGKNDLPSQAETISSSNVTIAGQIQGDVDCFRVTRKAGERISVEVDSVWLTEIAYGEAENDLSVQILDEQGKLLARNDDSMLHVQDPIIATLAPRDGDYIVRIQQSVPLDSQVNYLAHIGTFVRPLVAFPPGGPPGQPVKFRLLGDPAGEIVETISLPSTVGDFDFFPGSTSAPTSEPGGVSPMALTLGVWFGAGIFGSSFLELVGFWSSGVGFSGERAAGTIGEFVLRGHQQSLTVFG
ncbi:MAG: PPC domain-containing protein, partial [Planctomycetia bacterium]|nr:PPC domain-containing protein [Planctomycetia bacterium]